jgi:hypothetical protein
VGHDGRKLAAKEGGATEAGNKKADAWGVGREFGPKPSAFVRFARGRLDRLASGAGGRGGLVGGLFGGFIAGAASAGAAGAGVGSGGKGDGDKGEDEFFHDLMGWVKERDRRQGLNEVPEKHP